MKVLVKCLLVHIDYNGTAYSANDSFHNAFQKIYIRLPLQGRFQILCLSGSYLVAEDGGPRNRTGGLSVSLSSPDGHVIGGGVAVLVAASQVQVNP